ncbi:META domain-containing protein [Roseomonas sp. PWR1]|uniref:META domain-containing protein n=1 Tax=Roseomonas nitratireducens TaxID=2820810 RepID=A0ABS4AME2_9PROT|nr:META domain-containing protein [Neoroseomonas nitratireducens]MBP0462528.1 META domain-containing protein [Neoroseomonas nitratireducens]
MHAPRRAALAAILILPGLAQAMPSRPSDPPGAGVRAPFHVTSEETPRGAPWTVEEIAGRGVDDRPPVELVLLPEGRAGGTGGCNRFTGGYTLDGAALRFGALAATRMACAPALMEREQRFFAAMAEVRAWRIEHGRLLLTDAGGGVVLRLVR